EVMKTYHAKAGGGKTGQLWGMTETAAGTISRPDDDIEIPANSAGRATPGDEIRVVSTEEGAPLPADTEGELQVRGCSVFAGYLDNQEANDEAFAGDGWFRTGDLAMIDRDGNMRITGRTKDVINRGGVKFNPADIEDLISKHAKVAEAAIVPMSDPVLGEKSCCFAVAAAGENPNLEELCAYLDDNKISKNKWPERLELIDEMPLTPTRKVMKGQLAASLAEDH
ncbi:MAG: AMP-binding protein, partial [Rhodospirillales bacterium]|nr:AMP-binding protein [Rhodospirillales bacterium]